VNHQQTLECVATLNFQMPKKPDLRAILDAVLGESCLLEVEIKGPDRFAENVRARGLFFWLARSYGHSWAKLAAFINHNHSTAMTGFRRVEARMGDYAAKITSIERRLGAVDQFAVPGKPINPGYRAWGTENRLAK